MNGKAMDVHEICRGQLRPCGEEQSDHGTGNTNCIEKTIQGAVRLCGVDGNENNVDAAKM